MIPQNILAGWRRPSSLPVSQDSCRVWLRTFVAVLCTFPALLAARAQDTNAPSLEYSATRVFSQAVETNLPPLPPVYVPQAAPAPPLTGTRQLYAPTPVPLPALPPLLRWGLLTIQPHLYYGLSYGDGIQATAGQPTNSFMNELDPGVLLRWGDHWSLDYTPMLRFYSSSDLRNTFDNAVTLSGGTTYEDWKFGLGQTYASSSDPIIETASQTDQQTFSTLLSADWRMNSKTSLELGLSQNLRMFDQSSGGQQLNDYNSWSTMDWLNYQFWPGFGAAIGAGFEYVNVSVGPDL